MSHLALSSDCRLLDPKEHTVHMQDSHASPGGAEGTLGSPGSPGPAIGQHGTSLLLGSTSPVRAGKARCPRVVGRATSLAGGIGQRLEKQPGGSGPGGLGFLLDRMGGVEQGLWALQLLGILLGFQPAGPAPGQGIQCLICARLQCAVSTCYTSKRRCSFFLFFFFFWYHGSNSLLPLS